MSRPGLPSWKMLVTPMMVWGINSANLDWKDPTVIWTVRGFFCFTAVVSLIMRIMIYLKCNGTLDERRVFIKPTSKLGVETEGREITVTEYDAEQLGQSIRSLAMSVIITTGLHLRFELMMPLILSGFHQCLLTFESQLFQIHVLGYSDSGPGNALKRPWAPPATGFEDIWKKTQDMNPKRREAKEKAAEKKNAGKINKALVRSNKTK